MGDTKNSKDAWDKFQGAYSDDHLSGFQTPSTKPNKHGMDGEGFHIPIDLGSENEQITEIRNMTFADFQNHIVDLTKEINRGRDGRYKKGTKILSLEFHINDEFLHH